MSAIRVEDLTHRYGSVAALSRVSLDVPEGTLYALLGPNGAGKSTLLQILSGLLRPVTGTASVLGRQVRALSDRDRARVGYVSEDQPLPRWMRLAELEAYLAPLYAEWDGDLADELRDRFRLDPGRKLGRFSRGERMKAAMLCALAPRPRLLLLDEPFTGMDALVKDELVRGLLEVTAGSDRTVLVASHDIGELEPLADRVGFIDRGTLLLSEPMDTLRERFRRVEVIDPKAAFPDRADLPAEWLGVEVSGPRMSFLVRLETDGFDEERVRRWFPAATRVEARHATLREVFIGLARNSYHPLGSVEEVAT